MSGIDRRGFIAASAAPLVLGLAGAASPDVRVRIREGRALLLHDATLDGGRRFADRAARHGISTVAFEGDRIRQIRALLRNRPHAVWGVSRFADEILVHDVARTAGYRRIALIRHGGDGVAVAHCRSGAEAIQTLATAAGRGWPEAFADLALGTVAPPPPAAIDAPPTTGMSWVMLRSA